MKKKPLNNEQVEEILDALEEENFEDETELLGLTGDNKTTYVELEIDFESKIKLIWGYLNDDCKSSLPSSVYQHNLKVLDYVFTGYEEEYSNVDWKLKSDKYKMPEDKELLETLTDALEEHKEECYFESDSYSIDDIYDEWDEDEIRELIEESLEGDKFALIDNELYTFDEDFNEVIANLGLDKYYKYELLDYDQAVQFLLDQDIEFVD